LPPSLKRLFEVTSPIVRVVTEVALLRVTPAALLIFKTLKPSTKSSVCAEVPLQLTVLVEGVNLLFPALAFPCKTSVPAPLYVRFPLLPTVRSPLTCKVPVVTVTTNVLFPELAPRLKLPPTVNDWAASVI
jgi:hypothetical protein